MGASRVYYNLEEIEEVAQTIHDIYEWTEYGINTIDASEYNFPGC